MSIEKGFAPVAEYGAITPSKREAERLDERWRKRQWAIEAGVQNGFNLSPRTGADHRHGYDGLSKRIDMTRDHLNFEPKVRPPELRA